MRNGLCRSGCSDYAIFAGMLRYLYCCPIALILLFSCSTAMAQLIQAKDSNKIKAMLPQSAKPDNQYISDYSRELTTRVFGSRKFTSYGLRDKGFSEKAGYRPNSPFNVGIGINYRLIGLNLGFNLPFINGTSENGKTRFLDLQTHFYGRKLVIDFYGQLYKGYYMPNTFIVAGDPGKYIRPDLGTFNVGLIGQYVVNGDRFSFRAAYLQNEVQKKSAGSMILGAALNTVYIRADSSVIPSRLKYTDFFNDYHFNRSSIQSFTLNLGYGYTWVLERHFFVTGSLLGGMGINYSTLKNSLEDNAEHHLGNEFNATIRFAIGYHSRRYFAGIHYVGTIATSSTPIPGTRQEFGSGNLRISIARRWTLKKKLLGFY